MVNGGWQRGAVSKSDPFSVLLTKRMAYSSSVEVDVELGAGRRCRWGLTAHAGTVHCSVCTAACQSRYAMNGVTLSGAM